MAEPLRRTYDGMPDPKVVIAVGTDAVSGGLLGRLATRHRTAIGAVIAGRCVAAGSPPPPFSILHALLIALGRLRGRAETAVTAFGVVLAAGLGVLAAAGVAGPGAGARAGAPARRALPGRRGRVGVPGGGRGGALAGHPARLAMAGWLGPGTRRAGR